MEDDEGAAVVGSFDGDIVESPTQSVHALIAAVDGDHHASQFSGGHGYGYGYGDRNSEVNDSELVFAD